MIVVLKNALLLEVDRVKSENHLFTLHDALVPPSLGLQPLKPKDWASSGFPFLCNCDEDGWYGSYYSIAFSQFSGRYGKHSYYRA